LARLGRVVPVVLRAGCSSAASDGAASGGLDPHFEFSTTVKPRVRAAPARSTFVFVGLTTGVEF
jgi:hypothetical protein